MVRLPLSCACIRLALLLPAVFITISFVGADDWPRFRGPNLDGISTEGGLRTSGEAKELWSAELGLGFSSPVISKGHVILSGHGKKEDGDSLYCFDEATGAVKWVYRYSQALGNLYFQGGTTGTATIDEGRVYQLSREGDLVCLNLENGQPIWKVNLAKDLGYGKPTWGFAGAPLVWEGRLYLNAGTGGLCLNKEDGSVVWKSADEASGYSTPYPVTMGGNRFLIFSTKRAYMCANAETGAEMWRQKWMTRYGVNASDPIASEDSIFISTGYGKGAILMKWSGEGEPAKVWQSREMQTQMNSAVLLGGYLYGISGNESQDGTGLRCVEYATGSVKWTNTKVAHGAAVLVRGNLLVMTEDGELQVAPATPAGYQPTFRQKVLEPRVWTVPVYANGRVYCRNSAGRLVVLDMKEGK